MKLSLAFRAALCGAAILAAADALATRQSPSITGIVTGAGAADEITVDGHTYTVERTFAHDRAPPNVKVGDKVTVYFDDEPTNKGAKAVDVIVQPAADGANP